VIGDGDERTGETASAIRRKGERVEIDAVGI
jgi:hypothetical protein